MIDRKTCIPVVNDMCLALFAAHYFKDYKSDFNEESDSQPEVLAMTSLNLKISKILTLDFPIE